MSEQPRELTPIVDFGVNQMFKDFKPHVVSSATPDPTPADNDPKGESAQGSAHSLSSEKTVEQNESETPVQTHVDKENGSVKSKTGKNTDPAKTEVETSSPPSSSPQNPGWAPPLVPEQPPTRGQTQKP